MTVINETLGESLGWMEDQMKEHQGVKPKHKWRETFEANHDEYKKYNGMKFEVLADITDDALRDEAENGYVRVYSIKLEDGILIHAFEDEVEEFQE
jgi:hypothetical protein